jgi:hypothetical protein
MGKMKELVIDIQEMITNGYDHGDICLILGCNIKDVKAASEMMGEIDDEVFLDINETGGKW